MWQLRDGRENIEAGKEVESNNIASALQISQAAVNACSKMWNEEG
ncbi:MAG: hypothetical protein NWE78_06365 [Candidatus Bathyarchaeota archaeon]|nr:hypothetical protein [Candidatus Bathyarchaeota archaeon]